MAGVYRPRHPERTVLYRVMFHHFERFVAEYEARFERVYGFFRPIVKEVVEKYLDFGNPRCGFARIRCPRCRTEHLLTFSCKTRGFCPSCHAKRLAEWEDWMRTTLLLDVPHRQIVFTIPKRQRLPSKGWAERFYPCPRGHDGILWRKQVRSRNCREKQIPIPKAMLSLLLGPLQKGTGLEVFRRGPGGVERFEKRVGRYGRGYGDEAEGGPASDTGDGDRALPALLETAEDVEL